MRPFLLILGTVALALCFGQWPQLTFKYILPGVALLGLLYCIASMGSVAFVRAICLAGLHWAEKLESHQKATREHWKAVHQGKLRALTVVDFEYKEVGE